MNPVHPLRVGPVEIGRGRFVLMAGPCVLESLEMGLGIAQETSRICADLGIPYIFKASFDKANRTSLRSYRGPGLSRGLEELAEIKERACVPVLTDIHEAWQAEKVARVADILQIPAFLCRQTDLLVAAAKTGRPVHVKKAQFLAPWDMQAAVEKIREAGNPNILVGERGTSFGYNQLVVDFRSLPILRSLGHPVVFDATHSVQMPGGRGTSSGGDRRFVPSLARAAVAIGIDALFLEVHPDPDKALSDGPNMIALRDLPDFLTQLRAIDDLVKGEIGVASLPEPADNTQGASLENRMVTKE